MCRFLDWLSVKCPTRCSRMKLIQIWMSKSLLALAFSFMANSSKASLLVVRLSHASTVFAPPASSAGLELTVFPRVYEVFEVGDGIVNEGLKLSFRHVSFNCFRKGIKQPSTCYTSVAGLRRSSGLRYLSSVDRVSACQPWCGPPVAVRLFREVGDLSCW